MNNRFLLHVMHCKYKKIHITHALGNMGLNTFATNIDFDQPAWDKKVGQIEGRDRQARQLVGITDKTDRRSRQAGQTDGRDNRQDRQKVGTDIQDG